MFREQIKVVDCSIRDGGLINDWQFSKDMVREVFKALCAAHVDYMEIGYRASPALIAKGNYGAWRFSTEDDIREVAEECATKLSIMVDIGRVAEKDILPKEQSVVSMVRVATYVKDIDKAIRLANHVEEKGYESTINIMAISKAVSFDLDEALAQIEKECKTKIVYIVDSNGALYSEQIDFFAKKFQRLMPTKIIGIHAHNNQQLGFANTIQAIISNCNMVDGTLFGIGRGAGNCPLELILGFLKNPKYDIRPLLDVIPEVILPLQEKIEWGYIIPYAITGILNEHPRSAIAMRKTERKDDYRKFYEDLLSGDIE